MTSSDGERLAPVTYLFGTQPGGERAENAGHSPSNESSPAALPTYASTFGSETLETDDAQQAEAIEPPVREERAPKRERFEPIENVSMYALARRGMSSREMHDYLVGRDFEADAVVAEIERLERVQLLDDAALAETLVRTLRERKGLGRSALNAELRRRKLDGIAIEGSMASAGDDELERATEIAIKRAPQLRSLDQETAKRRLGAFLMRKGYGGSVVSAAVSAALAPSGSRNSGGPVFR
ncbi:MAG: regulatory protein RecX [Rhodoglobus sp.]